ncbi:Sec23-binding domain of Sec16-domain-containing protein [Dichomitus squalens]|uniref:Protein transport protein sec16 n=1 Tax=Dichomitus squalens TaxID=114155 RepID=A0A4Q9QDG6_9APHY|nr:Sec23-binding domain of Sec16-domain-containing protein [Dichomitus squalens]
MNGSAHMTYQPSYGSPVNHGGAHGAGGPFGGGAHAGGDHPQEGLPQVNDTYAPSAYTGLPQEASPSMVPSAPAHDIHAAGYGSPVSTSSNGPAERVASPLRNAVPEVEEVEVYKSAREFAAPIPAMSSSPPTSAGLRPVAESAWPNEAVYQPQLSSSPERTRSPPQTVPPSISQAPATAYDPYAPKSSTSDRAKSPGASSVHSVQKAYEPPRRDSATKASPISRPLSSQSRRSTLSNAYEPQTAYDLKRAISPAGSVRSVTAPKQGAYDPYAPADKPAAAHGRQTSNGSMYSTTSATDPYAPARYPTRQSSEHTYGSFVLPSQPSSLSANGAPPTATYDRTGGQVVTLAPQTHSHYAPSPSLLGTNDPLGRTSARVPVISFGFGGKLVTCFHGANMNTGFDVALSSRQSTDIKIHLIHKVISESVLDTSAASYPGPLYSDPGSPTASLVRTGAQALKAKKARVIKYLEDRAEEINGGLGYHKPGSVDRSRAEAKRILVLLLKAMVENDGRLSGNAQVDAAVRAALVPQEGVSSTSEGSLGSGLIPATSTEHLSGFSLASALPNASDHVVTTTSVRASQLDKISDLLARGDRRGACHYAADEKLWSHALLIASSVDKECWKEVVTEWIRAELVADPAQPQDGKHGREPLRVAYSLFGGNGAAAVQELVHPSSLLQHGQTNTLQIPQPQLNITPMTPNFPTAVTLNISQEVLASWAKTAAMILSYPLTPESSQALTALGDQLVVHQWIEAAHACYLLSPQTSPIGGGSRLTLLGSPPPSLSPTFYKDPDPIIFSEILEFATSLATPAKGQEPFNGLPHLQPYRLIRAASLAEIGHVQLANRYCEAITACINRGSPVLNITFVEQLKILSDRLIAAPQLDKSGSWIGGKMAKPSLDSIGNWLEGRFTKFIAGETDSPRPEEAKSLEQQQKSYSGPFANYSSISSATTSAYPSPHQSVTDLSDVPPVPAPPFRTGSAMGLNRPPSRTTYPINRSSSAMDYVRPFQQQRGGSPIARVASASAATFADATFNGQARGPYGYSNGYSPASGFDQPKDSDSHGDVSSTNHSKLPSASSWWGASEPDATTPTASSFGPSSSSTSNSEFISLMDDPMLSMTPTAAKMTGSSAPRHSFGDDDDDLGLGNASSRKKPKSSENGDAAHGAVSSKEEEKTKAAESQKPAEVKQSASSGWLSRLWKRDSSSPAPVKANLGEQSSFYFDKELGKWVNKNSNATESKPTPPPPPPRAQTVSPGRSFGAGPPPPSPLTAGPPPARPATAGAIDLSSEPPRRPPTRIRSNLVPNDAADQPSAPPSPMPTPGTPPPGNGPPAGRARGGAAKRAVRNRYVDVFQQEGAA